MASERCVPLDLKIILIESCGLTSKRDCAVPQASGDRVVDLYRDDEYSRFKSVEALPSSCLGSHILYIYKE